MSQRPALNHREVERRFSDSSRILQVFALLHLRPGSSLDQISETLKLDREDVLDSLRDLYWGGWILVDSTYGFWPVPVFPLAPLLFWIRQFSTSFF